MDGILSCAGEMNPGRGVPQRGLGGSEGRVNCKCKVLRQQHAWPVGGVRRPEALEGAGLEREGVREHLEGEESDRPGK